MQKALISGITGQDGSYLSEFLLEKGYEVHGIIRRTSTSGTERIDHLLENKMYADRFFLHNCDLMDFSSLLSVIKKTKPTEIYNLGAQSEVGLSFNVPIYTVEVTGLGTLKFLEALRQSDCDAKFYQASTSELFGGLPNTVLQDESTQFSPKSPYGIAKLFAYWTAVNYRETYGIFTSNGILFNHESPRRGENFVTRKITIAVAKIVAGKQEKLVLGNLNAKRDWGYAKDYVCGMWLMLQQDKPDDYILATGETHTVREFVEKSFALVGENIIWKGVGADEKGYSRKTGKLLVEVDKCFFRPAEVEFLQGNSSKAEKILGWKRKVDFDKLVELMVENDLNTYMKKEV